MTGWLVHLKIARKLAVPLSLLLVAVTGHIGGVTGGVAGTRNDASQVLDAASRLTREIAALRGQLDRFLETVRAA